MRRSTDNKEVRQFFLSSIPISMCAILATAMVGCVGFTAVPGAQIAVPASASSSAQVLSQAQCHLADYEANISTTVINQCTSCHGSPGNGNLILQNGGSDAAIQANYALIAAYIEPSAANADATSLLGRVGGTLAHPLKFNPGSAVLTAFENFAGSILSDPTCSAADSGTAVTPDQDQGI
jgi:hypothetical protein